MRGAYRNACAVDTMGGGVRKLNRLDIDAQPVLAASSRMSLGSVLRLSLSSESM